MPYFLIVFAFFHSFSNGKKFDNITKDEGLSNYTALCLLEDADSYVWISSKDGLNRNDGVNIKTFKHVFGDSSSLINNEGALYGFVLF